MERRQLYNLVMCRHLVPNQSVLHGGFRPPCQRYTAYSFWPSMTVNGKCFIISRSTVPNNRHEAEGKVFLQSESASHDLIHEGYRGKPYESPNDQTDKNNVNTLRLDWNSKSVIIFVIEQLHGAQSDYSLK